MGVPSLWAFAFCPLTSIKKPLVMAERSVAAIISSCEMGMKAITPLHQETRTAQTFIMRNLLFIEMHRFTIMVNLCYLLLKAPSERI